MEDSFFSKQHNNWPSYYSTQQHKQFGKKDFVSAWCHGATGIGLARIGLLKINQEPGLASEIAAALVSNNNNFFTEQICLCHGNLGRLDLVLQAKLVNQNFVDDKTYYTVIDNVLRQLEKAGLCHGIEGHSAMPVFMMGLAGVACELLRIAFPHSVPSVLSLEL